MSRTYRRKNCLKYNKWVFIDWEAIRIKGNYIYLDTHSEEAKKAKAKYHSDATSTMQQVPKWYKVHFCRKPFRRKENIALIEAVKYLDEDISFPVRKLDADYYW